MMTPRVNPVVAVPKKMRQSLTLFCAKHVLTPEKPVTREEVVDFLKKAGHPKADSTFEDRFLLPL
jgi:hypothetical protein